MMPAVRSSGDERSTGPSTPGRTLDPYRVPSGTTILFGVLIAAVLATSLTAFSEIYANVPWKYRQFMEGVSVCEAKEPVLTLPTRNINIVAWKLEALRRASQCEAPLYLDQTLWVLFGIVLLFGLTGLLYLLHPWWIRRRKRLVHFPGGPDSELSRFLADLTRQAGVARQPVFLLDSYARTAGGMAFGRFGRRYVKLDAGLVARFTHDRESFRAVVMHELAHLRNRDVDVAYLTMAIWRSVVGVALLPVVLVTSHPKIFETPLRWRASDISLEQAVRTGVTMLFLTALVFLTRNALLRVRETYADARVASYPDSVDSLRHALRALPARSTGRIRAVLATHPTPAERLNAIADPTAVLLRAQPWALFGAGVAAAMITVSLQQYVGLALPKLYGTNDLLAGLAAGAVLVALLGVAVWRAVARVRPRWPAARDVVTAALALSVGYLFGERLALYRGLLSSNDQQVDYGLTVLVALALLLGGLILARWMASAMYMVLVAHERGRAWSVGLIGGAILAATPWFATWVSAYDKANLTAGVGTEGVATRSSFTDLELGTPAGVSPMVGRFIQWSAELASWAGPDYGRLDMVIDNPLAVPGLALLCLPIAVMWWPGRRPVDRSLRFVVRVALTTGLIGWVGYVVVCVGIVLAVKALVPASLRDDEGFIITNWYTFVALAVVVQAAVAGTLAAMLRRHRAVLIPLAVLTTGILAAATQEFGLVVLARCVDLYATGPQDCVPDFSAEQIALMVAQILIEGTIVAVPAALVGAGLGVLYRHLRRGSTVNAEPAVNDAPTGRLTSVIVAAATAMLVVAVVAAATAQTPRFGREWFMARQNQGFASRPPASLAWLSYIDPCVVGTWREAFRESHVTIDGRDIRFVGKAAKQRFGLGRTAVVDFGTGMVETARSAGHSWERVTTGTITFTYENRDGKILPTNPTADGTVTVKRDGVVTASHPLRADLKVQSYSCRGDEFTTIESVPPYGFAVDLQRTSHDAPVSPDTSPAGPGTGIPPADLCVVGTWIETFHEEYTELEAERVRLISTGRIQRFNADGTGSLEFGSGNVISGTLHGKPLEFVYKGKYTFTYTIRDHKIIYGDVVADGTVTVRREGFFDYTSALQTTSLDPDKYTCSTRRMRQTGTDYTIELRRS